MKLKLSKQKSGKVQPVEVLHLFIQVFHTHTIFLRHTPSFTYNFATHNFALLVSPPPHPLSFLLSPSLLQHLVLIIGRSCLAGLSGPLIVLESKNLSPAPGFEHVKRYAGLGAGKPRGCSEYVSTEC